MPIAEQTVAIVAPLRLRRDIDLVRYAPSVPPYDRDRFLPQAIYELADEDPEGDRED